MATVTKVFFLTTMLFASNFAKAQNRDNEKMEVKKVIKTYLTVIRIFFIIFIKVIV